MFQCEYFLPLSFAQEDTRVRGTLFGNILLSVSRSDSALPFKCQSVSAQPAAGRLWVCRLSRLLSAKTNLNPISGHSPQSGVTAADSGHVS